MRVRQLYFYVGEKILIYILMFLLSFIVLEIVESAFYLREG